MLGTQGIHSYEEMMRALLWPNAVASAGLIPHGCLPPLQHLATVCEGPGGFRVAIDVHQFAPNELTVKTKHHTVVIEGKHEERPDAHGTVTRHFVRRFVLPEEYDPDHVATSISSDGVLVIVAPKVCAVCHDINK